MKIIYKQPENKQLETYMVQSALDVRGVHNCYLKWLCPKSDQKYITKKAHHHTGFEVHIVVCGYQVYEFEGSKRRVNGGDFILIYPNIAHKIADSGENTQKFSITFSLDEQIRIRAAKCGYITHKAASRIFDNMDFITCEAKQKRGLKSILIEDCLFETIVSILRFAGLSEGEQPENCGENAVLNMAKRYINDNIESPPEVKEVSAYCSLSPKQLTRLFARFDGSSPGDYIKLRRIERIETLLRENVLSLSQISERLGFSSEYYFNSYFKKHAGMPPGEYRKMLGK